MTSTVNSYCSHCSKPVDLDDPSIFREATIWISGEKSNRSALRLYTGVLCCADCMTKLKDKQPTGEPTLFDEPVTQVNMSEWHRGFEAGWRHDELVLNPSEYSHDYKAGYQAGQAGRAGVGQ